MAKAQLKCLFQNSRIRKIFAMQCPKYTKAAMWKKASFNWTIWEHVYMSPEVNSNRFEISLWSKISRRCKVTSHEFRRNETHFGASFTSVKLTKAKFQAVNHRSEIKLRRIIKVNNYCACVLLQLLRKQPLTQHLFCIN